MSSILCGRIFTLIGKNNINWRVYILKGLTTVESFSTIYLEDKRKEWYNLYQRQTFKKLCELKQMKSSLEKRIAESDGLNVSCEVVLCNIKRDITKLENYLRGELE